MLLPVLTLLALPLTHSVSQRDRLPCRFSPTYSQSDLVSNPDPYIHDLLY